MRTRGSTVIYDGNDIADALGMARNTPCGNCRHGLYDHNHGEGARTDLVELGDCTAWDRRTTTGHCKCTEWTA